MELYNEADVNAAVTLVTEAFVEELRRQGYSPLAVLELVVAVARNLEAKVAADGA